MQKLNKMYRLAQVVEIVGLRKTAIEDGVKAGTFPRPVPLTDSKRPAVAWLEDDLVEWQKTRIAKVRSPEPVAA